MRWQVRWSSAKRLGEVENEIGKKNPSQVRTQTVRCVLPGESGWKPELAPNSVSNRLRPCGELAACRYCGPHSLRLERGEQRAALAVALVIHARALQALQVVVDAVEIAAHLRNLAVERGALRVRTAAEQIEEAGIVAALTGAPARPCASSSDCCLAAASS